MLALIDMVFTTEFLYSVFRISTPLIFGTMAAYIADKAGLVNMAIEGMMLMSALFGVILSSYFGGPFSAFFVTIIIGALMGLLMGYISEVLKAPIILTGIALNIIAAGASVFILFLTAGDKGFSTSIKSYVLPSLTIPVIKDIPLVGAVLSGHNIVTYLAFITVALLSFFINKTKMGLRIRATGENELAAKSVGIKTLRLKLFAISLSGALSAVAGCYLSMGYLSIFTTGMTSGRGFISLCANAMSGGSAMGGMLASILFGIADTVANSAQQTVDVPVELILTVPYTFVIITFVIYNINKMLMEKKLLGTSK